MPRIKLIPLESDAAQASAQGKAVFKLRLGWDVAAETEVFQETLRQTLDMLRTVRSDAPWGCYLTVDEG
ncbi:MAG: hypothetical protein EXR67_04660 [Dehalococcoidia bacterium]|nr:hypothetical protein [Dehalococcoidia bacterium]